MKKIAVCLGALLGALALVPACGGDDATEDLPPVYSCQGKALACASRTVDQCKLGGDCQVGGTCGGIPAHCDGLSGSECVSQDGCTWSVDALGESCTGAAKPCADQNSQLNCTRIKNCSWTQSCTGDQAPSCIALTQTQCKQITGCSWMVLK